MRIISLVPSATETLSSWGRTPIACTRFCERPDLESVGGTKDPDLARIAEMQPDLVVMDVEENRVQDFDILRERGIEVHTTHVRSLDDVNASMSDLAECVDATWQPVDLDEPLPLKLRAFVPIWRRPWIALGEPTYGASLLRHFGIASVYESEPYPRVGAADIASREISVVLAPSEPYPFGPRQRSELEVFAPTFFIDGKDLFWWGERTRGALTRMKESLGHIVRSLE